MRATVAAALLTSASVLAFAHTAEAQAQSAAAAVETPASNSTQLEEVVVTARRQAENLQSVPVSVSVVRPEAMEKRGNVTVQDLAQMVPGVGVSSGNDRSDADITIRGQSRTPATLAPAVITYFDEVPLPRVAGAAFFDLDNIQILKGPQGTLFGRVTDGGAVLLTSRKPADHYEGYVDLTLGDYDLRKLQAAVSIPLVEDKVLLRLAGSVNRRDGYTRNLFNGSKMDNVHTDDFRASLVLRPFEGFENRTVFQFGESNENCCGSVVVGLNPNILSPSYYAQELAILRAQQARGPYVVNEGVPGYYRDGSYYTRNTKWVVNTTTWRAADNLTIKNIFGYIYNRETTGTVVDGATVATGAPINVPGVPMPTNFRGQKSDELQAQGNLFDGKLTYTAGLYWENQFTPGPNDQYVVQAGGAVQVSIVSYPNTVSRAVYGQVSYDLGDLVKGLKLDAGLRYSSDRVRSRQAEYVLLGANPIPAPNLPRHGECLTAAELAVQFPGAIAHPPCDTYRASSDATTYTLGLNYQLDDHKFVYASLRRGYRPGGVNYGAGGSVGLTYGPETDLSREAGIKADWDIGGMHARTNATVFWDTTRHLQQIVTSLAAAPVSGIVNTGVAQVRGLEFEGVLVPVRGLTLTANWSYNDGHFETSAYTPEQIAGACPADVYTTPPAANGVVCPLREINSLPRNVVSASAHYELPLDPSVGVVTIGGDWFLTSKSAPGSANSRQYPTPLAPYGGHIPGYNVLNLDATWKNAFGRPLDLTVFVTNVTNKAILQSLDDFLDAGSIGVEAAYYAPPRMFGVSLRYHFGD